MWSPEVETPSSLGFACEEGGPHLDLDPKLWEGSFSTKKRGEDNLIALFIMAVRGSDEADQPGLTATVNMLRKAGLKLQYELFR